MRPLRALGVVTAATLLAAACGLSEVGEPEGAVVDGGGGDEGADEGASTGGLVEASFGGGAGDAAEEPAEPLPYAYRVRFTVTPGATPIQGGASIALRFDHMSLVTAGKSLPTGNDVRVFYKSGPKALEIDRVLDLVSSWNAGNTTIWFRLVQPLQNLPDSNYYLYYGDPNAGTPPADPGQVYAFWDGFDGNALGSSWSSDAIGGASGAATTAAGVLHIAASTGDISSNKDDFFFVSRPQSGDFVADARVLVSGGSFGGWSRAGGLMIRSSEDPGSAHRYISPAGVSGSMIGGARLTDGAQSESPAYENGINVIPEWVRLERVQQTIRAFHSDDGVNWTENGGAAVFTNLADPALVGVPFANVYAGQAWVDLDWVRIRVYLPQDPTVELGLEEPGPFTQ
jgi:Domain of unknown function (DUF2341)